MGEDKVHHILTSMLAVNNNKVIKYEDLMTALPELKTIRELEDVLIEALYRGIIQVKFLKNINTLPCNKKHE